MLPAAHRLRRSADFTEVLRRGRRRRTGTLVVHQHRVPTPPEAGTVPAKVGLVVSRAVGGSVVRHHVSRRLRAQVACRLDALPVGSSTVIRALPASAAASSTTLGTELDAAFTALSTRRPAPADRASAAPASQ